MRRDRLLEQGKRGERGERKGRKEGRKEKRKKGGKEKLVRTEEPALMARDPCSEKKRKMEPASCAQMEKKCCRNLLKTAEEQKRGEKRKKERACQKDSGRGEEKDKRTW